MNQSLNHLVLLYKCNCIRIISINAYNKNVETIWHDCIISHIKLWFLKLLIKSILIEYYMAFFIWHGISTRNAHISPRAHMGRGLIWLWYEKCHIITYLSYTSMRLSWYLWQLIVFRNHSLIYGIWCNHVILFYNLHRVRLKEWKATNDDTPLWTKDYIILCCWISVTV
jgi:hypothetical protein